MPIDGCQSKQAESRLRIYVTAPTIVGPYKIHKRKKHKKREKSWAKKSEKSQRDKSVMEENFDFENKVSIKDKMETEENTSDSTKIVLLLRGFLGIQQRRAEAYSKLKRLKFNLLSVSISFYFLSLLSFILFNFVYDCIDLLCVSLIPNLLRYECFDPKRSYLSFSLSAISSPPKPKTKKPKKKKNLKKLNTKIWAKFNFKINPPKWA